MSERVRISIRIRRFWQLTTWNCNGLHTLVVTRTQNPDRWIDRTSWWELELGQEEKSEITLARNNDKKTTHRLTSNITSVRINLRSSLILNSICSQYWSTTTSSTTSERSDGCGLRTESPCSEAVWETDSRLFFRIFFRIGHIWLRVRVRYLPTPTLKMIYINITQSLTYRRGNTRHHYTEMHMMNQNRPNQNETGRYSQFQPLSWLTTHTLQVIWTKCLWHVSHNREIKASRIS